MNLTHIKPRFILDVYKLVNNQVLPLNESESKMFSTKAQANEILSMLPSGVTDPSIVDTMVESLNGQVYTNYRDDSDTNNVYCLAIKCTVQVFVKYNDLDGQPIYVTGEQKFNVGVILASAVGMNNPKLSLDKLGQLKFVNE